MSAPDPMIAEQFGWTDEHTWDEILSDPVLGARFAASYLYDPDYSPPACRVWDEVADGPGGPVTVRVYEPAGRQGVTGALVWAHGGGFIYGSLHDQEADGVARELATRAGILVASVGYDLADGAAVTYPRLHRQVSAAVEHVRSHATALRIDPQRIALGGASAGANLALAAALERRDESRPPVARLLLVYPLLHRVIPDPGAGPDLDVLPVMLRFPQALVDQLYGAYLGPAQHGTRYASIEGQDLAGLPPTIVVAAEYDDLRPSADAAVDALDRADTTTTHYLAQGAMHGFLSLSGSNTEAARTLARVADELRAVA